MEPRNERGVLGRGESLLKHCRDLGEVAANHCRRVEPQAGKDLAPQLARLRER